LSDRPFPFQALAASLAGMHEAELTLRFGATRLRASVHWPRADAGWLALVLTDELPASDPLVSDSLVVALPGRHPRDDELATLEWLAEHGRELGGTPRRLMVAGAARAAWLAIGARDSSWPRLDRQVLVRPRFGSEFPIPSGVAGVASATVVCGRDPDDDGPRYVALLRDAGVAVEAVCR
jgi:hypothetical protein